MVAVSLPLYSKKAKTSQISSFSSLKLFNISELLQTRKQERIQSRKYLVFGCAIISGSAERLLEWKYLRSPTETFPPAD